MSRSKGLMLSELRDTQLPIIFKRSGFDFIIIDYEHGSYDYKDLLNLIISSRLTGITVIIRLANNARKDIIKIMDMGADGLLLPMTNKAEDIKEVVKYGKYSPVGQRGISTVRAHALYNPGEINSYLEKANKRTKIYAQIETRAGVDQIDSILSVVGVDGFFIGPNDLSSDLGVLGNDDSQAIKDVISSLGHIAKKLNKEAGIITRNKTYLEMAKSLDFKHYSVGSELSFLINGGTNTVEYICK